MSAKSGLLPNVVRLADGLNERFVALGRVLDDWTRRGERAMVKAVSVRVRRRIKAAEHAASPPCPDSPAAASRPERSEEVNGGDLSRTARAEADRRLRDDDLARRARVRLSDLHLRVGRSIYQLDAQSQSGDKDAIERQLRALLDEIERLEGILKCLDDGAPSPRPEREVRDGDWSAMGVAEHEKGLSHG
jgi:hypothetical protein